MQRPLIRTELKPQAHENSCEEVADEERYRDEYTEGSSQENHEHNTLTVFAIIGCLHGPETSSNQAIERVDTIRKCGNAYTAYLLRRTVIMYQDAILLKCCTTEENHPLGCIAMKVRSVFKMETFWF